MRTLLFLSALTAAIGCGPVQAADLSEVDIILLAPRSPDLKPFTASVPAEVWRKAVDAIAVRAETQLKSAQTLASAQSVVPRIKTR